VTVTAKVLSSIAITTPANKLVSGVGETLDIAGLVITATYDDGSTADITGACTFTPASGSTLSTAGSVTVTATFGGKTTSYNISVISLTSFAPNFAEMSSFANSYSKGYVDSQNRWSLVYSSTMGAKVYASASGLQQVGSSNNPVDTATIESGLFVSSSGESKVTKVVFTFNGASSSTAATVSVKVGGVSFGSSQSFSGNASKDLTFENATGAFGHIQILITSVSKGVVLGTIKVYSSAETSDAASASAFAHDVELANGCATDTTYSGLKTKYDALSASAKTIADALTIDDFANASTTDIVIGRCTVAEKMEAMKNRAGLGSGAITIALSNDAANKDMWIVAGLSVLTMVPAVFFLLRKRKEQR
jgi:hypothetical protein